MNAPDLLVAALTGASNRQLVNALRVLGRVVADRPDRTDAARAVLDDRLPDLVGRAADDEDLRQGVAAAVELLRPQAGAAAAIDRLPPITTATARLVGQVLLTAGPSLEAVAAESKAMLPELARLHNNLNIAFGYWREWDLAVKAGRRAVELHRRLVDGDGDGDGRRAGLASALGNLAVALVDAGDADAGLAVGEEAVTLWRQVVDGDDDPRHRRSLAGALINHSARLGGDARVEEALSAIEEAAATWRALVEAGESGAAAGLARSLSNLAVRLGVLGRHDEALDANDEALRIRRELAATDPDEHLADLALTLSNRSTRLSAVGRAREGLDVLREAIGIRRQLAAADPAGYLANLATSLHNLSFRLTELGQPVGERLAASSEAVEIRRRLARDRPGSYRAALAAALHTESVDHADCGDLAAAVSSAEEAVTIRRSIATNRARGDRADEHWARLGSSLRNLSIALAAAGRLAPALDAAEEAVEIGRGLATRWPDAFREDLADAVSNLSSRLDGAGRAADALVATQEALGLRRLLARDDPDRHLGDLATSLNNLSVDLSRAGRLAEAAAASEESVTIRRRLAATDPDRYQRVLALNLNNHGASLAEMGRPEEAAEALGEAVAAYRDLVGTDSRRFLPDLTMALGNLANQLAVLGRRGDAQRLLDDALTAYADTDWAGGVIRLGRGWWQVERGALRLGIDDLCRALALLDDDPGRLAAARTRLRRARQLDPVRFDVAWGAGARGELPVWLRYVEVTGVVADVVRDWVDTADLDAAEALLSARAGVLLTDTALARLHHLVDANPEHPGLRLDRDIVRAARARGVAAAYAEHRRRLWCDGVAAALEAWVGAADLDELRAVVTAEPVLLGSDEAATQMQARLAVDPASPALLVRAGLLELCRHGGIDTAFALVVDDAGRNRPPGRRVLTAFEPRDLARARLRAGHEPDNPDAAFVHAVLAVLTGHEPEADAAITRCAQLVPSWRRRELAKALTDFVRDRPELADPLARTRTLMAGVDRPHLPTS